MNNFFLPKKQIKYIKSPLNDDDNIKKRKNEINLKPQKKIIKNHLSTNESMKKEINELSSKIKEISSILDNTISDFQTIINNQKIIENHLKKNKLKFKNLKEKMDDQKKFQDKLQIDHIDLINNANKLSNKYEQRFLKIFLFLKILNRFYKLESEIVILNNSNHLKENLESKSSEQQSYEKVKEYLKILCGEEDTMLNYNIIKDIEKIIYDNNFFLPNVKAILNWLKKKFGIIEKKQKKKKFLYVKKLLN